MHPRHSLFNKRRHQDSYNPNCQRNSPKARINRCIGIELLKSITLHISGVGIEAGDKMGEIAEPTRSKIVGIAFYGGEFGNMGWSGGYDFVCKSKRIFNF